VFIGFGSVVSLVAQSGMAMAARRWVWRLPSATAR
jgi:hypothetical protein